MLCVLGGIATGTIGWSGNVLLLPAGMLFPAFWAYSPSRSVAALVAAAHFLGASRGLPQGASIFFGSQYAIGIGLWFAASLVFVAVYSALWSGRSGWPRMLRYLIASVLMSLPPFGIMGWASPITAAGVLFPGWSWFGLAATAILLLMMTTSLWRIAVPIVAGCAAWSAAFWTDPNVIEGWTGINTTFRYEGAGQHAGYEQQQETIAMVRKAAGQGAKVAVLPESALGLWTPTTERLWTDALSDLSVTVIGGAAAIQKSGYDTVMVEIAKSDTRILYRERMPVPVSMWQPWRRLTGDGGGANAYIFYNPVMPVAGYRAAPLICYEQLIIWPVLQSMALNADIIVAIANGWWTGGSNITAIQRASVTAWAKLFDVPLVIAFNE
ncbi:conjugal transfer protein TraB (plasmid) [Roseibium algicola]|uniref:Conjugal transfer protein TraB n=1 Tax=Roseibium algicola TaxID=2857014 RepID=A0ABN4X5J8_9HYPH|nr:conjugal transfer protein TraB [Roseibium aggregatum]